MLSDLSKEQIESEIQRLAPFGHKVDMPYELSTYIPELPRPRDRGTRVAIL